jgi:hypothetical protein
VSVERFDTPPVECGHLLLVTPQRFVRGVGPEHLQTTLRSLAGVFAPPLRNGNEVRRVRDKLRDYE